jgi:hypothetical protein
MPGERYADCCVTEHGRFGDGSVMVWAGISIDGKTDLHVIPGNLSGESHSLDRFILKVISHYTSSVRTSIVVH